MSNPYETAKESRTSVLGSTLRFKGRLSADEDLLIQGYVEGTIKHSSNLTIGKKGRIKGNVRAEFIDVEGSVNGDLTGTKTVAVRDSAKVEGNIYCPSVTLSEGAKFNGSIDMSGKTADERKAKPRKAPEERSAADAQGAADEPAQRTTTKRKSQRSDKKSASAA